MGNISADQYKKRKTGIKRTGISVLAVICLVILMAFPAHAAGSGSRHHADTADYCMRVSDVTVGLSELSGLSEGEKQALVEKVSDYAIYTWSVPYRAWADKVSPRGDFGSVSWDRAGSYKISISLPSLTDGASSQISYTLTIIDDLPPEPSKYTIKVSFVDEESGLYIGDPYILPDQAEGSSYDLTELTEKIPEGYALSEVLGDLAGRAEKDTEILVMCRKIPARYSLTVTFVDEETGLALADPLTWQDMEEGSSYDLTELTESLPEGYVLSGIQEDLTGVIRKDTQIFVMCRKIPARHSLTLSFVDEKTGLALADPLIRKDLEEGSSYDLTKEAEVLPEGYEVSGILGDLTGTVTEDLEITILCKKTEKDPSDKDKDKDREKDSGKKPSPGGSSHKPGRSSGSGNSSGRKSSGTSAAAAGGSAAVRQQTAAEEERTREQAEKQSDAERESEAGTAAASEETEEMTREETAREETEERDSAYESAALAVTEEEEDQSDLGGALLPQSAKPERGLSPLGVTLGILEAGILAVLSMLIISDLKLIRWFEEKRRK